MAQPDLLAESAQTHRVPERTKWLQVSALSASLGKWLPSWGRESFSVQELQMGHFASLSWSTGHTLLIPGEHLAQLSMQSESQGGRHCVLKIIHAAWSPS